MFFIETPYIFSFVTRDSTVRRAILAAVWLLCIVVYATPGDALSYATIEVAVHGVAGKKIENARVVLTPANGAPTIRFTAKDGLCIFKDAPPGFYAIRASADGYETASRGIEVRFGVDQARWDVSLEPSLKTIAAVSARQSSFTETYKQNAAFGRLFVDLAGAMNSLGHADIRVGQNGSLTGASIEGKDPLLTNPSFNGIAVQSATSLNAIDVDALSSARIDDDADAFKLSTLGPAPFPVYDVSGTAGGISLKKQKATAQGTTGTIGYAVAAFDHGEGSSLSGQTYLDTSGLSYKHYGYYSGRGFDAHIDIPVSEDWIIRSEYLGRTSRASALSTLWSGPVPDGYGPGATSQTGKGTISTLGVVGALRNWSIEASISRFRVSQSSDFASRFIAGLPAPYAQSTNSDESNVHFFAVRATSSGATFNININYSRNQATSKTLTGLATIPSYLTTASRRLWSDINYNFSTQRLRRYQIDISNGLSFYPLRQNTNRLGFKMTQQLRNGQEYYFDLGEGSRFSLVPDPAQFADPSLAQFDCRGSTIVAQVPNDFPSVPRDRSIRIGYAKQSAGSILSVEAYDQHYSGVTLSDALVSASNEPTGFLPVGYISSLLAQYYGPSACAKSTSMPHLFLRQDVSGVGMDYRGASFTVARQLSKVFTLRGDFSYQQALLRTTDARLFSSRSPYLIGHQLPNVPFLTSSLSMEYRASPAMDFLANLSFVSRNNVNNLPGHSLLTIGSVLKMSPAFAVNFIATNVFHEFSGGFTSTRYAQWLPTEDGSFFQTLARPLTEPGFFATINFHWEHEPKS